MTLLKGVYRQKNQNIYRGLEHLFTEDRSWFCKVPFRVSFCVPAAFIFGRLVLQWGHACAKMCNYGGLRQRIHEKSSLQIIYTYRWSS